MDEWISTVIPKVSVEQRANNGTYKYPDESLNRISYSSLRAR